jgi:endonuclease/exonuclease/phosphatase family metal-dependent hydrolase
MRLVSYNVENLFSRAKVLDLATWAEGRPMLAAFERFNRNRQLATYSATVKARMLEDLVTLRVLVGTSGGKLIRQPNRDNAWAELRENRGDFIVERRATGVEIVATGAGDWTGWAELIVEPVDEVAEQMTAKVINELAPDVLAVVEADNRPALVQFNEQLLAKQFQHAMLVDGNDPRGIDVGLMTRLGYKIDTVASHVDEQDTNNPQPERRDRPLFSRDARIYRIESPDNSILWVIVNHLKSQSRTGDEPPDDRRRRQADRLAEIYTRLRNSGAEHVAVVGDFNRGPDSIGQIPVSLEAIFGTDLVDLNAVPQFDPGPRPGTWQTCTVRNRLDYIFLSPELIPKVQAGGVFRKGLWGNPTTQRRPTEWTVYDEITSGRHAASDHAALWVDLDLT